MVDALGTVVVEEARPREDVVLVGVPAAAARSEQARVPRGQRPRYAARRRRRGAEQEQRHDNDPDADADSDEESRVRRRRRRGRGGRDQGRLRVRERVVAGPDRHDHLALSGTGVADAGVAGDRARALAHVGDGGAREMDGRGHVRGDGEVDGLAAGGRAGPRDRDRAPLGGDDSGRLGDRRLRRGDGDLRTPRCRHARRARRPAGPRAPSRPSRATRCRRPGGRPSSPR